MELTGRQIDKYLIKRRIGQGGMADVYLALDTRLDREVAFKMIRTEMFPPVELERILKRFEIEAKALAKLNHPNIIQVIDYGDYDGKPYLVMPYLPGGTLKDALKGAMDWREAFQLLLPIVEAVSYAHKREILHRDIKPSNILMHTNRTPLITDFGVAKILSDPEASLSLTLAGIGTPNYMSPEQWEGKAEYRSDQYSLGVVLYRMVTGEVPYAAETPMAVMTKVIRDPLPPARSIVSSLPVEVEDLISKMMMKDPAQRYADLDQVSAAMTGLLARSDQPAPKPVSVPENKPRKEIPPAKVPQVPVIDDGTRTMDGKGSGTTAKDADGRRETKNGSNKKLWIGVGIAAVLLIGYFTVNTMYQSTLKDISDALSTTDTPEEQAAVVAVTETIASTKTPAATATAVPSPTAALTFDDVKDEGYFALETDQGELILLSKDGNYFKKLTLENSISSPVISNNGSRIAYVQNSDDKSSVAIYDYEKKDSLTLAIENDIKSKIAWSYQDEDILFIGENFISEGLPLYVKQFEPRIEKYQPFCWFNINNNSINCRPGIFRNSTGNYQTALYHYITFFQPVCSIVVNEGTGSIIVDLIQAVYQEGGSPGVWTQSYSEKQVINVSDNIKSWSLDPIKPLDLSFSCITSASPDSRTYLADNKNHTGIVEINAEDGSFNKLITYDAYSGNYLGDSEHIAFMRNGHLFKIDLKNNTVIRLDEIINSNIVSFDYWEPVQ